MLRKHAANDAMKAKRYRPSGAATLSSDSSGAKDLQTKG
jgi:hypothetical protein